MADKSSKISKHVNVALGSNSATQTPNVVNAGLELFPTVSEAHGIHSPASANEVDMNDARTTVGPTLLGNTPGMYLYANVIGELSQKALNFCTLLTPAGNVVVVVIPVESIRAIKEQFANTAYGFFLGKRVAYLVVANYVMNTWGKYGLVKSMLNSSTRSSYARALIEVRADVELKDSTMVAMPKLVRDGFFTYIVRVNGNKKKDVEPTIEVNNSKPFDALNSVKNDVDLGTNGGTSNLASEKANFTGSSFWNVKSSNTIILVDDEGKPLAKVDSSGDHDSEDEVASVDNEMENFLASKKVGYGTNRLLEQWKETYENDYYDFDPYDDDMYEGQDIPDKIQAICDNLDIKV
ncbi:hypothetical protein Tco_0810537 [Tanacetum coccineum]